MISNGFRIHEFNKCVYSKFTGKRGVIICLYMDDMLIFGRDQDIIENTKKFLSSSFVMKDMSITDIILGIRIKRDNNSLILTQTHYSEKILKRFNQYDSATISTPFDS